MNEELKTRFADITDLKLLSVLATTTFYEAYFQQDNSKNLAGYIVEAFNINQLTTEIEDKKTTFIIIELKGKAVGFAKLLEDSTAEGIENLNAIEIKRIYILEKVQGKNVGLNLIRKCFEIAIEKGYEYIWLGVWEENLKAQKFYAKLGFEKCGNIEFVYGDEVGKNYVLKKPLVTSYK